MGKVFLVTIFLLCTVLQGKSWANPEFNVIPLRCALQGIDLNLVQWDKRYLPNGLEDYMFDTNNDNRADLELLVPIDGDNRLPIIYWFNDEFAITRYAVKDALRDGTCKGMSVIESPTKVDFRKGA